VFHGRLVSTTPYSPAGELVLAWLTAQGRSRSWLARQVGVEPSVLWRWLHGSRTPHVASVVAIERITGVPASAWTDAP
jgi:transcriptional regulator with XRE-family HTH domain